MIDADFVVERESFRLHASFTVKDGTALAVLGPSGSGKTTALRALAGLLSPQEGRIEVGAQIVFDKARRIDLPPERRRCGVVFQDYALFPHLSALQNVAYPLECQGRRRPAAEEAAGEWLDRFGISSGDRRRRPGDLSGGQRQRVAVARALASESPTLLLDEPFGALDARTRETARLEMLRLIREARRTVLLVTHDVVEARIFGDQIAVLENGRVSQTGAPEELLAAPRTPFVAQLAGLNLLPARLGPRTGEHLREAAAGPLLFHLLSDEAPGSVFLAFRPSEALLSLAEPDTSARNVFQGIVTGILPVGSRQRVLVDAGQPLVAEISQDSVESLHLHPGKRVYLFVKATAIETYR